LLVKELYALHQLFRQRQNIVLGPQDVVNGNAAGNLLEVQELHFQSQCASLSSGLSRCSTAAKNWSMLSKLSDNMDYQNQVFTML